MDQKSGETISKYMIRLKDQAQKCSFGDFLQESLRDRFVAGIIDSSTQKKLLQEENLTFDGAVDIALSAESADNELHNIKGSENAHQSPQYLHAINNTCKHCESLINDYKSIFEYKSGPIKGIKCHLGVKADFIPKFYKFRQVPFALKQLVEDEIDKLVDLNILSPIDRSDCASPLVCVAKPDGQIRLCADFKKSLNPYLEDVKYPIPNIDSVLSNFQGNKLFNKLDLSKAYHQIEMDDISKKYLVVSTHKGLYKYNRLAFGIKNASEIFQKTMESFFSGINDVYIYFDDILIASEDLENHLDILKRTLNILKENNFTINKNKCLFVKNEIEYLGHKINGFGIYPLKDKLACIKNCPIPKNTTELKSFLGFLSFYSKFLPNLSDLAYPLYNLLKKNVKWSWNVETDGSFNSCKNALDETSCLSHYSLNLPLILSCDASQVGIGATLSHLKDGEERPVCLISRTLNVHERKYSQVEREGLAIVFAVNKLKNYLFGRKFAIYTDHKPLITIFGDKTNLPPLIANRLHRWALTLSNFNFEIKYKKGKDNIIPDSLSRFPQFQKNSLEYNDGSGEILLLNTSIIDHVLVAHETHLDRTLFKLHEIIETGELPSSPNDDLIPYLKRIDDFTILQKCIFLENRMVIPKSLHEKNGISHVTSPPYHPKSNGQAEVSVREVKKLLKKLLYENEQVELDLALSRALFFIRTDANIRKGTSPAELFIGRKIRSRLSVLSKEEVKVSKVNGQYVNKEWKPCEVGSNKELQCTRKKALCLQSYWGNYKCHCQPGFVMYDDICRVLNSCHKDGLGSQDCNTKNALCRELTETDPEGYECYCKPDFVMRNGTCQESSPCEPGARGSLDCQRRNAECKEDKDQSQGYRCSCQPGQRMRKGLCRRHRKRRQFKQTDAFTRGMVIGLKRAGWSIRQIAADTHLGASKLHRLWRRWLEQGNVAIYRNAGATRVTSARVDRSILRQAVAAPQATCTAILQHVQDTLDHSISTRTISRRLVANGLHSCRPLRRLPLTPPNRRQRLEWCRARSTWMTEWHRVVFSDESRFCLSSDSRRVRVWCRRGERSNPAAIVERPTVRQRGIMVWGAIAYDSRSPLLRIQGTMTAQRYVDDVLRPVTLPYLQRVPNALYQQDNARPHTARISQQALQDVQMLPWPPYSPDLSPIEHVWDIIGRRLHALPQPRSEDELRQMVEREWRAIPQDAIRTLIDSLPRRVAACIAVRGGPTCY
ncbi:hypothetical protein LAZ67_8002616 [Cordylochernes scorpioides]|uniref:Reverse transcriptase n=1 Tax=Cordylochernes scorpioides TaxID=51811 RepID=A0ABY6KRT2_9ARAC|nr:hypothetical protein LAZ67_8002616 [Cordylochernes scorpioides]